jgi:hypothetical protein
VSIFIFGVLLVVVVVVFVCWLIDRLDKLLFGKRKKKE